MITKPKPGWIEVITGSMFSGKSEELIRRLRRAQIARQKVQIFKPAIDNRYSDDADRLAQRDEDRVDERGERRASCSTAVDADTEVVGIDEGQFFDAELPAVCTELANARQARHRRRARSGLSRASRSSRCRSCWRLRSTSRRRWRSAWCAAARPTTRSGWSPSKERVLVGAAGTYEARCRHCFDPTLGRGLDVRSARRAERAIVSRGRNSARATYRSSHCRNPRRRPPSDRRASRAA